MNNSIRCVFITVLMSFALYGCIKDDYSRCPKVGSAVVRVTYNNWTHINFFKDEVMRVDFFVFDEQGLFVERQTDLTGPFTDDYKRNISLPFGKYQVVVWCNLYDDHEISADLQPGITKKDDLLLKLKTTVVRSDTQPVGSYPVLENFVQPYPTTLLYGATDIFQVYSGEEINEHIDLVENTHDIHVTLRWKNLDGGYCFSDVHQKTTRAYITGNNGDVKFDNTLIRDRNITYIPLYRDPSDPDKYIGQTGLSYTPPQLIIDGIAAVLPDFRVMRLTADGSTEKLVVTTLLADGTEKIVYARSIVDLIRLTGHYDTQRDIDQEKNFHIAVDFRCLNDKHQFGSTWIAVTIFVNGWVVKEIESEI